MISKVDKKTVMTRLKAPARREQLMSVAMRLFAAHGFDATTTAAIAEAAGITEPVLYRHFKSKRDLFINVLRNSTRIILANWSQAVAQSADAQAQLRSIAAAVSTSLPEISDAQRVLYGAAIRMDDPVILEAVGDHANELNGVIAALVVQGVQAGQFRKDMDVQSMTWALINACTGYAFTRLNFPSRQMDIRISIDLILRGMTNHSEK